jgi:hypothetical protein
LQPKLNPKRNISSSLAIIVPDDVRASHDIFAKKNLLAFSDHKHEIPSSDKFQIDYANDLTE